MSKKSVKMGVTYAVTIIVTLLVVGGVVWYMFDTMLYSEKKDPTANIKIEQLVSDEDYEPVRADSRTLLIIIDTEKRQTANCFLIARFLPVEKQMVFLPLPTTTKCSVNGTDDSIYEFYRNGGTDMAVKAAESCIGTPIDHYIRFNENSFNIAAGIFGGVDYDIPYNLIYSNTATGEETVLKAGRTFLDPDTMRKVITYPNYNSGEEYRAKCLGVIVADLFNKSVNSSFANHIDEYYNAIINSDIETNITSYDYNEISDALKYAAKNTDKAAIFVPTSGTEDENGLYAFDANFVRSLTEWLKLYSDEETME